MRLVIAAIVLAATSAVLLGPAGPWLERAHWPRRAPRSAVVLWQAMGVGGGLAAIGAGLAVAVIHYRVGFTAGVGHLVHGLTDGRPLAGLGLPDALGLTLAADVALMMAVILFISTARTIRARARHRRLLDLVTVSTDRAPGAVVLEHPRAAAYCLPGWRPRIVVSSGTVHLLAPEQLAAVVEHERGHAAEHHGLVMLPLAAYGDLLRWIPYARRAPRAVAELLEMAADDHAARRHEPRSLAEALGRMVLSSPTPVRHAPSCAFGATETAVTKRVHRLLEEGRCSPLTAVATLAAAAMVVGTPLVLALWA